DILRPIDTMHSTLPLISCCRPLRAPALSDDEAQSTAAMFKALADPARVRVRAGARAFAADGKPPSEAADRGGPARARAARQVGPLHAQAGGARHARRAARPGGGSTMTDTATELREAVR